MKFKEIEFKYNAAEVELTKFLEFADARSPTKTLHASGYDHFYHNTKDPDAFCRLRVGPDMNQLTFKRKLSEGNNYIRTEHNLDLTPEMTRGQIDALLAEFGYLPDVSIFKNCFVRTYKDHTLVYYICYDTDLQELGRFLEIEASESFAWASETHAWDTIAALERICKPLGISTQGRIRRSLFEMFREAP